MENRTNEVFSDRIDFMLKKMNTNKRNCAEILNLKPQSFTDWKKRGTIPAADTVIKLADYLGVSVRWLVTGEEDGDGGLTADERWMLETWRGLSPDQRGTVRAMLEGLERKKSGGEEKSV